MKKIKKNVKVKKINKLKFILVLSESLNFLVKGTKCKYFVSYILSIFLPVIFLFLGSALLVVRFVSILFRK